MLFRSIAGKILEGVTEATRGEAGSGEAGGGEGSEGGVAEGDGVTPIAGDAARRGRRGA